MTEIVAKLWQANRPMTAVGLAMLPIFVAAAAGIFLDPRTITGAPAWLKPAKFAISISIYLLTLSWVYSFVTVWQPVLAVMGWITAGGMVVEIIVISLQAYRGVASHFNVATPLDAALFGSMGTAIALLWLASMVIAAALFAQNFDNQVIAAALRCGMLLTVLGSASGVLMPGQTKTQMEESKQSGKLPMVGAHTVGAPDGGPGLPVVGWSTLFGDLRVPHFLGLHGLQIIPLLAWLLLAQKIPESRAVLKVYSASASYFGLYGVLLWQALRGEALTNPSPLTLIVFAVWLLTSSIGWFA